MLTSIAPMLLLWWNGSQPCLLATIISTEFRTISWTTLNICSQLRCSLWGMSIGGSKLSRRYWFEITDQRILLVLCMVHRDSAFSISISSKKTPPQFILTVGNVLCSLGKEYRLVSESLQFWIEVSTLKWIRAYDQIFIFMSSIEKTGLSSNFEATPCITDLSSTNRLLVKVISTIELLAHSIKEQGKQSERSA